MQMHEPPFLPAMSKMPKKAAARPLIKTPQELVHIKHKITLRQYKYWLLMLRAYREAYELGGCPNERGFYEIPITTLEMWLGYELVRNELRNDLEAIRKEPIIYNVLGKDGRKILQGAGFISEWELTSNWIGFKLPRFLQESVEQLDLKSAIFQKINWEVFNSFTGKYEAILYKLCRDYIGAGRTPIIVIKDYRDYMGLKESEYAAFKDLNKFVIAAPIKRINDSPASDITVEAIFTREARKVATVQFAVTPKYQTILDLGDDPAFRFAKVVVPLAKQKEYLAAKGAERVEFAIHRANAYGEEKEKQGQSVNYGALYHTAIEEDWGEEYKAKQESEEKAKQKANKEREEADKVAREKRLQALRDDYRRELSTLAIKALSEAEKAQRLQQYLEEFGEETAAIYNPVLQRFCNKVEELRFSSWLRVALAPEVTTRGFNKWLRERKGLDPKRL